MNATPSVTLLDVTRDQVALTGFTHAVERIRRLEGEIESCFEQLDRSIEGCRSNGIEVMPKLSKPVDAAWAAFRNRGYADRA